MTADDEENENHNKVLVLEKVFGDEKSGGSWSFCDQVS